MTNKHQPHHESDSGSSEANYYFPPKSKKMKFADGCHQYGWIINLVVTILMFAYFVGATSERVEDIRYRVGRLEIQWDNFLRSTRGISSHDLDKWLPPDPPTRPKE